MTDKAISPLRRRATNYRESGLVLRRDLAVGPDVGEGLLATTADLCCAAGSRNVMNSLNRPTILSLRRLREH
jgi:hypothetical protein